MDTHVRNQAELLKMLGKHVRLRLTDDPSQPVIAEGLLLAFEDSGQAVLKVEDDMGFIRYCWPVLDIEVIEYEANANRYGGVSGEKVRPDY